jgi:hypothetical protein
MIIVQLAGGLGNQMFQYALGRRLAEDRGVQLKLDLRWFENQNLRKFELDQFNISSEPANEEEIYRTCYYSHNRYIRKVFSITQSLLPYWKRRVVKEDETGKFDKNILYSSKNCHLRGYWQSEKYFSSIADTLRNEFSLKHSLDCESIEVEKEIQTCNSVSVHIRRGDYVPNLKTNRAHSLLSNDYYESAVKQIQNLLVSPHFYVFSDDIEWVNKNMKFSEPCTFIKSKKDNSDYEEMWLMSQCQHHITANSSFSWWGSWLGEKQDSLIISPKQWFTQKPYPEDTIPDRWLRI